MKIQIINLFYIYFIYFYLLFIYFELFRIIIYCHYYYIIAHNWQFLIIPANSGFKEAPPTKKPSISYCLMSSPEFFSLTEPPYWIRIPSATSLLTLSAKYSLMYLCTSCAWSGVATFPVPIAQTGS